MKQIYILTISFIILFGLGILLNSFLGKKKFSFESTEYFQTSTEHFKSNEWTTNEEVLEAEKTSLNDNQKKEVQNMIQQISKDQLKELIANQSPLLAGPQGPPGIQGPAGTKLIASGRLVNKSTSENAQKGENIFFPKMVVTRTEGTNPTSSLAYLDTPAAFASFQDWQLDIDQQLKNRYDSNCLTMNKTQDKLYMDKCDITNGGQKWGWDSSNRLISTSASTDRNLKCIGLSYPEENVNASSIPGCVGDDCLNIEAKKFLVVKDCDINNIKDDEVWGFL